MRRLLHTVALTAVCVTLIICIWRDYSLLATLKRAAGAYLAFFFLTGILLLVYRTGVVAEQRTAERPAQGTGQRRKAEEGARPAS
jgi:hypothetical protein